MKLNLAVAASVVLALVLVFAFGTKALAEQSSTDNPPINEAKLMKAPHGLQYEDIVVGTGAKAHPGQRVAVHYTGWLYPTGEKFDSSKDRDTPFEFRLGSGQVIKGWDEGVKGMQVGGKRILLIPPQLAYGKDGAPPVIPPDSTLKFEVELMEIK